MRFVLQYGSETVKDIESISSTTLYCLYRSDYHFFFFVYRVAGTVGAIVTCPLEVVKTRLQSSSAFLYPPRVPDQQGKGSPKPSKGILRPEQRRQLCNTLLRKRPQVI